MMHAYILKKYLYNLKYEKAKKKRKQTIEHEISYRF